MLLFAHRCKLKSASRGAYSVIKTVLLHIALTAVLTSTAMAQAQDSGSTLSAQAPGERRAERQGVEGDSKSRATEQPKIRSEGQSIRERLQARRDNKTKKSMGQSVTLAGRDVSIWAPTTIGPAPLVLFSHGFQGCPTQVTFLTQALADSGFVVVAPKHADAACGNEEKVEPEESFRDAASWSDATYRDRRDDMVAVLDALRGDASWRGRINFDQVGLMGHSLGGYTVLGIAGGWPSWRLSGVGAILALSPVCQPLAQNGSLGSLSAPVMFQGGTRDLGITPSVKRPGGCYDKASAPAEFIEFEGAGHFAWTDRPSPASENIAFYAKAFFDSKLRGQSVAGLTEKKPGVSDLRKK
jgi:pimeloyl-ACP methyl ester carboxylesterase